MPGMDDSRFSERIRAWAAGGGFEDVSGREVFVRSAPGGGPALLFLHGYPSSSYDFRTLIPLLGNRASLAFDFIGFGLSEKPRGEGAAPFSLFRQADVAEGLVRRHFADREVFVVAHDMGTSVATELMARDIDGALSFPLRGALLFSGSIVLDQASLTPVQQLLRSPLGPLAARLASKPVFRHQFGSLFTAEHPLTDEEADDQWDLICHRGGRTLANRLVSYLGERVECAGRWHGAIRNWPGALSFAWGLEDPVATTAVLDALRELRPSAPVAELEGLGHYPQLEDPGAVAGAVEAALHRAGEAAKNDWSI